MAIIVLVMAGAKVLDIGLDHNVDYGTTEVAIPIKGDIEKVLPVGSPDAHIENQFTYMKRVFRFQWATTKLARGRVLWLSK